MKAENNNENAAGSDYQERLVRRCTAYNALHATEFTPSTYDEERTRVPRMIAWDEGWEACESSSTTPARQQLDRGYPHRQNNPQQNKMTDTPDINAMADIRLHNAEWMALAKWLKRERDEAREQLAAARAEIDDLKGGGAKKYENLAK